VIAAQMSRLLSDSSSRGLIIFNYCNRALSHSILGDSAGMTVNQPDGRSSGQDPKRPDSLRVARQPVGVDKRACWR
jgi:hypothetical protein